MQFPLGVSLWSNKNPPSPGTSFGDMQVATPAWWDGVDVVLGVNLVSSTKDGWSLEESLLDKEIQDKLPLWGEETYWNKCTLD